MSQIARSINVRKETIHRTVHEDLSLKSYVIKKRQLLTEDLKERRKIKAAAFIDDLKQRSARTLRLFSDEKNFCQDRNMNRRNDRWLNDSTEDVPIAQRAKYPAHIIAPLR